MKKSVFSLISILMCSIAHSQENNGNAVVSVENDYNPIVVQVKKKGFTPTVEENSNVTPLELVFSKRSNPYDSFTSERNVKELLPKQEIQSPGYVRLGYGTTNDADAKLAYRIATGKNGDLRMLASFDGYKSDVEGVAGEWNSRMFRTVLDACYTHTFETAMLSVGGNFTDRVFNYAPIVPSVMSGMETDKQNNIVYDIYANGFARLSAPLSIAFKGGFTHNRRAYSSGLRDAISENHANIGATLRHEIFDSRIREVGTMFSLDLFTYNGTLRDVTRGYGNVFSFEMNPFVGIMAGEWSLRAGANINMRNGNSAFLAVAPDIRVNGNLMDNVALYVTVGGGRSENGFAAMDRATPYWNFVEGAGTQLKPSYRVVDVEAGIRTGYRQLSADVFAGYTYTKDELLQTVAENYVALAQDNTSNLFVGTRIGYDCAGVLDVSLNARYDHSSCDNDYLLMMKPEFTVGVDAEVRPFKDLTIRAGYNFTRYTDAGSNERIDNRNELFAHVGYKVCKNIGLFLHGDNLLDCSYYEYPGIGTRGIRVSAGASVAF